MWEDVIVDEILKIYLVTSSYREYENRKIHGRLEIPSYFHISFIKKKTGHSVAFGIMRLLEQISTD